MADEELINQLAVHAGAQAPQPAGVSPTIRLAQFWLQAPVVWFMQAECVFPTQGRPTASTGIVTR